MMTRRPNCALLLLIFSFVPTSSFNFAKWSVRSLFAEVWERFQKKKPRLSINTLAAISIFAPSTSTIALEWDDRNRIAAEVWRTVDELYVDRSFNGKDWFRLRQDLVRRQYKTDEELYEAIKTTLSNLNDKYTRYLTPTQYDALYRLTQSEVVGIGIEIGVNEQSQVILQYVDEGSPAADAGFQAGDVLLAVNGINLKGKNEDEVAEVLSNQIARKISLKVQRGEAVFEHTCEKRALKLIPVQFEVVKNDEEGSVGIIRIQSFTPDTQGGVIAALQTFHESAPPVKEIVIDLRNNPGGVLPTAVDTANLFLPPGKIVVFIVGNRMEEARMTDGNSIPSADPDLPDTSTPCYLLVDHSTASAAEVFAGALQENGRAKVIGERSFGKGIIQNFQQLTKGGISVTIARYETPLHHNINKVGIQPDIPFKCEALLAKQCLPEVLKRIH